MKPTYSKDTSASSKKKIVTFYSDPPVDIYQEDNEILIQLQEIMQICPIHSSNKISMSLNSNYIFVQNHRIVGLTLRNHTYPSIPKLIQSFSALILFIFGDYPLTDLESLTHLPPKLKYLGLPNTNLSIFPSSLYSYSSIQHLDLQSNPIANNPIDFNVFSKLEVLNLANTMITHFPRALFHCDSLRELNLSRNYLQQLPKEIGQFFHLEKLNLHGNKIAELPPSFKNLHNLRKLDISSNHLRFLPSYLSEFSLVMPTADYFHSDHLLPIFQHFLKSPFSKSGHTSPVNLSHLQKIHSLSSSILSKLIRNHPFTALECEYQHLIPNRRQILLKLKHLPLASLSPNFQRFIDGLDDETRHDYFPNILRKYAIYQDNLILIQDIEVLKQFKQLLPWKEFFRTFKGDHFGYTLQFNRVSQIFIHGKNLPHLPLNIANLTDLKIFKIIECNLNYIPESFKELRHLTHLDLSYNKLEKIDGLFENLPTLASLRLDYNAIPEIPTKIEKFTTLQVLSVAHNNLTSLPLELGNLTRLTELNISMNQISFLPSSLGKMTRLSIFKCIANNIRSIPDSLSLLRSLREIDFSHNPMDYIPDFLRLNTQMTSFSFSSAKLTSIPDWIGNLTKLEYLYLYENRLREIPKSLRNLSHVKKINLSYNYLNTLPDIFNKMIFLDTLDLSHNYLQSLPDSLGNAIRLIRLNIGHNYFQTLPYSMVNLKYLSYGCDFNNIHWGHRLSKFFNSPYWKHGIHGIDDNLPNLRAYLSVPQSISEKIPTNSSLTEFENYFLDSHIFRDQILIKASQYSTPLAQEIQKRILSLLKNIRNNPVITPSSQPGIVNFNSCLLYGQEAEFLLQLQSQLPNFQIDSHAHRNQYSTGFYSSHFHILKLQLIQTDFYEIPASIQNCTNLQYLQIDSTRIRHLPSEIAKCSNLQTVIMKNCKLQDFPDVLPTSLKVLILSQNQLSKLPKDISRFSHLETLNLEQNLIEQIHPDIGKLSMLSHLNFSVNHLSSLPSSLSKMHSLRAILLQHNRLTEFPNNFHELSPNLFLGNKGLLHNSWNSLLSVFLQKFFKKTTANSQIFLRDLLPIFHFTSTIISKIQHNQPLTAFEILYLPFSNKKHVIFKLAEKRLNETQKHVILLLSPSLKVKITDKNDIVL